MNVMTLETVWLLEKCKYSFNGGLLRESHNLCFDVVFQEIVTSVSQINS